MEILPENEVRLYKNVPFYIDYKNVILFDNSAKQTEYFNSLSHLDFSDVTYTRPNGSIKVNAERDSLLEYNYMSFTNHNYTNKTFYAFITGVEYVNPNTSLVRFTIDEWQTWCFDLTFRDSFIERKHCRRWNSDGTPVINTQPENLNIGSEYIVKDHKEYNNNLYWVCLVTSLENKDVTASRPQDVPTILSIFYYPVYKTTSNTITKWQFRAYDMSNIVDVLNAFRNNTILNKKLVSAYIISEPPFAYSYGVSNNTIVIDSYNLKYITYKDDATEITLPYWSGTTNPNNVLRTFPKYGNLKNNITESKLLMYPYSYVELVDGQGNTFDIKNEYLDDTQINVRTFTSGGLNSKQAHIVDHYRYTGVQLQFCRWELGNGIINSFPNNLTIIDDYSAAYLQGNANQLNTSINNTINQSNLNKVMQANTSLASVKGGLISGISNIMDTISTGALNGGLGAGVRGMSSAISNVGNMYSNILYNQAMTENTSLQSDLTSEKAVANALAKIEDIQNVADNVSLQGGDVYFTFQNQYNGYCLVYKQISSEYIRILEDYFKKYGYAYNKIEVPNLHTRKSWDYIRTIDCNIYANINNESLNKIKDIFNTGVTIWHTTDVDNYNLNNDEI